MRHCLKNQTNKFPAVFGEEKGGNEAAKQTFAGAIKQANQDNLL